MKVLITGGAGYIGSLLTGVLLQRGYSVVVIDDLLFGGDSLLAYLTHPQFEFHKANVTDKEAIRPFFKDVEHVIHLAALVGFPACQAVGPQVAWLYNLQGTKNVYELARENKVKRFVFSSTYSNYGIAEGDAPVTEESPPIPNHCMPRQRLLRNFISWKKGESQRPFLSSFVSRPFLVFPPAHDSI